MEEKGKKKLMSFYITRENIDGIDSLIADHPYYTKSYLVNEAIQDLLKKFED